MWSYYYDHIAGGVPMRTMQATKFKSQCLAVIDEVQKTGQPLVITKRGKPVVRLVPEGNDVDEIFDSLRGKAKIVGDIINTIPLSDWEMFTDPDRTLDPDRELRK
jgi:prevent-host-death family protein